MDEETKKNEEPQVDETPEEQKGLLDEEKGAEEASEDVDLLGEDNDKSDEKGESDDVEYEIPERYQNDPRVVQFAKDNKLTQEQLNNSLKYLEQMDAEAMEAHNALMKEEMGKLRGDWGSDFDTKLKTAKAAVKRLDKEVPGMVQFLKESKAATNPQVIRIMEAVGRLLVEKDVKEPAEKKKATPEEPAEKKKKKATPEESNKPKGRKKQNGWDIDPLKRLYPKK